MHTKYWSENLNHLEDLDVYRMITLQRILEKYDGRVWNGFIWLGKFLWTR